MLLLISLPYLFQIYSPYEKSFEDSFKIEVTVTDLAKPPCKICEKSLYVDFMQTHVAKHILEGLTVRPCCGFCGLGHTGNVRRKSTRNGAHEPLVDSVYFKKIHINLSLELLYVIHIVIDQRFANCVVNVCGLII